MTHKRIGLEAAWSNARRWDRGACLFEGAGSSPLRAQHSLRIGAHETKPRRLPNEAVARPLLQRGGSGARDRRTFTIGEGDDEGGLFDDELPGEFIQLASERHK